jgi:hypothetical protein
MNAHPDLILLHRLRRSESNRRAKRTFTVIAAMIVTLYLMLGVASGSMFKYAVPAISLAGEAYIALTWPAWINGSPLRLPIYRWCFALTDGDGE